MPPRDLSVTAPLCLACSSSLPPRLWKLTLENAKNEIAPSSSRSGRSTDSARRSSSELFLTQCCGRPICPSCATSNPRLVRYNPCIACLGGLGAIRSVKASHGTHQVPSNVDGAVRDEDVFVIGDEDEDEASEMHDREAAKAAGGIPPSSEVALAPKSDIGLEHRADSIPYDKAPDSDQGSPGRYDIRPDDTLLGISFRLGIDGRTLCKLNDLPPSTLRTTPHLLHTRTFLVLPHPHSYSQHATNDAPRPEKEARRERERALVAFQRVTKETDDGIAKAYVALAENSDSGSDVLPLKAEGEKVSRRVDPAKHTIEERAVDWYLDDDEWERRERAEGRGVYIPRVPTGGPQAGTTTANRGGEKAGNIGWWQRWGWYWENYLTLA